MPPFRIHQTKSKPERILIRLLQGRYVLPSSMPIFSASPVVAVEEKADVSVPAVPEKKKTVISMKQMKQLIMLLQQSQHKNLSKLLSPELKDLLSLDEQVNPDQLPTEEELLDEDPIEALSDPEEEDEDVLIIDI
jgi:hypothetical protein